MDVFLEILMGFGFGLLGGVTYTLVKVWKNFKPKEFSINRFFVENKVFWLVSSSLNLVIVLSLVLIPEVSGVIETMGLVVESGDTGFYWIGIMLSSGANNKLVAKKVQDKQ